MFGNLGQAGKYLGQAARMLIGIPDYDNLLEKLRKGCCIIVYCHVLVPLFL